MLSSKSYSPLRKYKNAPSSSNLTTTSYVPMKPVDIESRGRNHYIPQSNATQSRENVGRNKTSKSDYVHKAELCFELWCKHLASHETVYIGFPNEAVITTLSFFSENKWYLAVLEN